MRLTIEEQAELRRRAEALGLSVPRYLHEKALSDSETDWERRQLIALRFEITRLVATIANNVNQLAKVANTSGQVAHAARLEQTLGDVAGLLEDLRGTGLRGTGL